MNTKFIILFLLAMTVLFTLYGQEKMEIEGAIVIGNSESVTPAPGTIRWTGTDFEGWDGNMWISLTTSLLDGVNGSIQDVDGNTYKTVKIGSQWWMAENLKTTRYNDGTEIPEVTATDTWKALSSPAYCWYDNDSIMYAEERGALYNFFVVSDTNSRNICPINWHVPSQTEYFTLSDYLGGFDIAGGKVKETGTNHWTSPNLGATNQSGFTAITAGLRSMYGHFSSIGGGGYIWSTTESGDSAMNLFLLYNNDNFQFLTSNQRRGLTVRCVRD